VTAVDEGAIVDGSDDRYPSRVRSDSAHNEPIGPGSEATVPRYLIIANYTAEGTQGLLSKGGTARRTSVTEMVEKLGGTVETFDFAFGEDDVFVICDVPDSVTAAAIGLSVGASGLVALRTVVLLTPEEIDSAAQMHPDYHGPGE
jgi:uncharacterized protein with GYD domain